METQEMKFCETCGRETPHVKQESTYNQDLLLSIITLGLWLPVWGIITLAGGNKAEAACTICKGGPSKLPMLARAIAILVVMAAIGFYVQTRYPAAFDAFQHGKTTTGATTPAPGE
jgi:hypothetical protein